MDEDRLHRYKELYKNVVDCLIFEMNEGNNIEIDRLRKLERHIRLRCDKIRERLYGHDRSRWFGDGRFHDGNGERVRIELEAYRTYYIWRRGHYE